MLQTPLVMILEAIAASNSKLVHWTGVTSIGYWDVTEMAFPMIWQHVT